MANEYRISITIDGKDTSGQATSSAARGLHEVEQAAHTAGAGVGGFFANMLSTAGGFLAANVIGKIVGQFGEVVSVARTQIDVERQLDQVIASTGGAAGVSADQAKRLASSLQDVTDFGDETTIAGENLLLTFTNIGKDVFPQTTATMLDMAQALHEQVPQAAIQLGKAMNDPIKGVTALQRVGVSFTEQQKEQIKTLVKSGDVLGAQKLILAELNKEFGGSAQAAAHGSTQLANAFGDLKEVIGKGVINVLDGLSLQALPLVKKAIEVLPPLIERASQGFLVIVQVVLELGRRLVAIGQAAFGWGANIVQQLAAGVMSAVRAVEAALAPIAAIFSYWLRPGSPPRLLPDLDQWGAAAGKLWADSFGAADASGIADLGSTVESILKGLVDTKQFDEQGVIPAVLGSRSAIADAIANAHQFGRVGEDAIENVVRAAGPAGSRIEGLVRGFFDLEQATGDVARAQENLNRITQDYQDKLTPLNADLKAIQDQKRAIDDQIRVRDLQKEIADDKTDDLTRQKDQLEIAEIQKRQQIDAVNDQKDAAVSAAQDQLDAAKKLQDAAQARVDAEQAKIKLFTDQNNLIGQQISLIERLEKEKEKKGKGGGGGGAPDLGAIGGGALAPKNLDAVTKPLRDIAAAATTAKEKVDGFLDGIRTKWNTAIAPALPLLGRLRAAFEDSKDPIDGLLNILTRVSPGFALIRAAVEAALPPIQSIVGSVFGIVSGLIHEHGAKIVADVMSAWGQVRAIVDGLIPPIQQVVTTVFGAIASFLAAHGTEIQALLAKAWDTIAIVVDAALQLISATVVPALQFIGRFIAAHGDEIGHIVSGAWGVISHVIDAALTLIQGVITAALQFINGDFAGGWQTLQAMNEQIWSDIQGALSGAWEAIQGIIAIGIDAVLSQFDGMLGDMTGIGRSIVDGIKQGISDAWEGFLRWIREKINQIPEPVREALHIYSPSQVFAEIGRAIIEGLIEGINALAPNIDKKLLETFATAVGEVANALSTALSVFADLTSFAGPSVADIQHLLDILGLTLTMFIDTARNANWRYNLTVVTEQMSSAFRALLDAMSAALDIGVKLKDQSLISQAQLDIFASNITRIFRRFLDLSSDWDSWAIYTASEVLDAASKMLAAVADGAEAFKSLGTFTAVTDAAIGAFVASIRRLLATFITVVDQFDADGVMAASSFADSVKHILDLLGAIEGLNNLRTFAAIGVGHIQAWSQAVRDVLFELAMIAVKFTLDGVQQSARFAEAIGTVLDMLGAVEGLSKLRDFTAVPIAAITAFGSAVQSTVALIIQVARRFTVEAAEAAGVFAEGAGKVVGIIGSGVDGFVKLQSFTGVGQLAITRFASATLMMVRALISISSLIRADAVAAAAVFAEGAGKVVGLIGSAVGGLSKLADVTSVPQRAITLLAAGVLSAVRAIVQVAGVIKADAVAAAGVFSDGAGKVVSLIGGAVDGFKDLASFTVVPQTAVNALAAGILSAVRAIVQVAGLVRADAVAAAAVFSDGAGKVVGIVGTAVENLAKIADFSPPQGAALADLAAAIGATVRMVIALAGSLSVGAVQAATDFAARAQVIFDTLSAGVDALEKLWGFQPIDIAAAIQSVRGLFDVLRTVITELPAVVLPPAINLGRQIANGIATGIRAGEGAISAAVAAVVGTALRAPTALQVAAAGTGRAAPRAAGGDTHYHLHLTTAAPTVSLIQEFSMLQASAGVSS
jgi:phage-related protein